MSVLDPKEYWDQRYSSGGNSGYGSYGEQLQKKLGWLKGLDINSITEIGCGDLNFASELLKLYPEAKYNGTDISPVVLETNRKNHPEHSFFPPGGFLPPADLLMCVDVLFHMTYDDEYEMMLDALEKNFTKYLAVTAYERDENPGTHVRIRNFDYKRFGEPIIREVVEEDGQLYFYLFKKPEGGIDLSKVTCVLNTKDSVYPQEVLNHVSQFPFGEILIKTGSDSPFLKWEMIEKARYDTIYYQDDDAICSIAELAALSKPGEINVAMKQSHFDQYKDRRMTMGFGWGAIFPKDILQSLVPYCMKYGDNEEVMRRDTEKLLTEINFPQNRFVLPVRDLPSAMAPGRLSMQPQHYSNMDIIKERVEQTYD